MDDLPNEILHHILSYNILPYCTISCRRLHEIEESLCDTRSRYLTWTTIDSIVNKMDWNLFHYAISHRLSPVSRLSTCLMRLHRHNRQKEIDHLYKLYTTTNYDIIMMKDHPLMKTLYPTFRCTSGAIPVCHSPRSNYSSLDEIVDAGDWQEVQRLMNNYCVFPVRSLYNCIIRARRKSSEIADLIVKSYRPVVMVVDDLQSLDDVQILRYLYTIPCMKEPISSIVYDRGEELAISFGLCSRDKGEIPRCSVL